MKTIKGMGDIVEVITTATGIKAIVDTYSKVTKKDCGCKNRKEQMNNAQNKINDLLKRRAARIETNKNNIK